MRLQQGRDVDVLQRVRVEDVMTRLLVNMRPGDSLEETMAALGKARGHGSGQHPRPEEDG